MLLKEGIKAVDLSLLENVLRVASLSLNKSVWVDCGHVTAVPSEALPQILALSRKAETLGVSLLFCRMRPVVGKAVKASRPGESPHLVASLADASRYCRKNRKV